MVRLSHILSRRLGKRHSLLAALYGQPKFTNSCGDDIWAIPSERNFGPGPGACSPARVTIRAEGTELAFSSLQESALVGPFQERGLRI